MASLLVGIILVVIIAFTIFFLLGTMRAFGKVGKFASSFKDIFEEDKNQRNQKENE